MLSTTDVMAQHPESYLVKDNSAECFLCCVWCMPDPPHTPYTWACLRPSRALPTAQISMCRTYSERLYTLTYVFPLFVNDITDLSFVGSLAYFQMSCAQCSWNIVNCL